MKLVFLDVGHGSCALVFGGKEAILFDCPPGVVLPKFLRQHGVAVIRHLVISHADLDHSGGFAALVNSGIVIEQVWMLDDQANKTNNYQNVRRAFASARAEGNTTLLRKFPHSDEAPAIWGELKVEWLGPNHEDRMAEGDTNTLSVIARLVGWDRGLALFPGDLTQEGFLRLNPNRDWSAEWLAAPHHGGGAGRMGSPSDLMRDLLALTRASDVFFSFSRDKYDLPQVEVVQAALRADSVQSVRCSQLSKKCAQELPSDRSAVGPVSQGAQTPPLTCCAGSILLSVTQDEVVWQEREKHDNLVMNIGGAMCRMTSPLSKP